MKTLTATLFKIAHNEEFTAEKRRSIMSAVLEEHAAKKKK